MILCVPCVSGVRASGRMHVAVLRTGTPVFAARVE